MFKLSSMRLVVAVGGLALSLSTGVGVVSAQPDMDPLFNTTCTYSQIVAALNAQYPELANQLASSPAAQDGLKSFLAKPPDERRRMFEEGQRMAGAAQTETQTFEGMLGVVNTCHDYPAG